VEEEEDVECWRNHKRYIGDGEMWNLYREGSLVPPLIYSDGRTQEDVVQEILDMFKEGKRVVFLHGAVGTGKSAIALNLISHFKHGGIVVVPTKVLQKQYADDYCKRNRFKIRSGRGFLRIDEIKGRDNFRCLLKKCSTSSRELPCTRKLSKRERRIDVAKHCPFFSPIVRARFKEAVENELDCEYESLDYTGCDGVKRSVLRRGKKICTYHRQFKAYAESDVIVMNSAMWLTETLGTGRKPLRDIEVIDECDLFLDSLTFEKSITQFTFKKMRQEVYEYEKECRKKYFQLTSLQEFAEAQKQIKKLYQRIADVEMDFEKILLKGNYSGVARECDVLFLEEFAELYREVYGSGSETLEFLLQFSSVLYAVVENEKLTFFLPNMKLVMKKLLDRSADHILMMSATIQSEEVLQNFYGLENFGIVIGEPEFQGELRLMKCGCEEVINAKKWNDEEFKRRYWSSVRRMIKLATSPTLVQIHAFKYLPPQIRESVRKEKSVKVEETTYSTVMTRGVDLRDELCRSIVLLKCPFPDLNSPILQAIKNYVGESVFWQYYHDIMRRNLIQYVGRGLRHMNDWVEMWSPDKLVHIFLKKYWKGRIVECDMTRKFEKSTFDENFLCSKDKYLKCEGRW